MGPKIFNEKYLENQGIDPEDVKEEWVGRGNKIVEERVKYHFSIHINFKEDIDVIKLSNKFKLQPYKLTMLADCKGKNKSAKMWYRTKDMTHIYTGEKFEKFVLEMKEIFKELPKILKEYEGICEFSIIFTDLKEKPCINLSEITINALNELHASLDFDFYV